MIREIGYGLNTDTQFDILCAEFNYMRSLYQVEKLEKYKASGYTHCQRN